MALCALLVVGASAHAGATEEDDEGADTGGLVEYVEVQDSSQPTSNTIATKLAVPLHTTPANVAAVGPALIYEQHAMVLGDALENVSGVNVQAGSGVHEFFSIRGVDSISSGLVLIDGAVEPEVGVYRTYNVSGVEVFKGPAGFLYGKNPLGGAINLVRKQPLEGDVLLFHGSLGSFDTQEATLDWNTTTADEELSFRLNTLWHESDRYRDDQDVEHAAINPSLTLRLGPESRLNINLERVDADYAPDAGLPLVAGRLPAVPRRNSYQTPGDFSEQTVDRFQVDYETKLGEKVTLRDKAYYRGLDWRTDGTLIQATVESSAMTPWLAPGEVQVVRDLALLDDEQVFFGNQLEAVFEFAGGGVEHRLLAGVEIAEESDEYTFDIMPAPDVELTSRDPTFVDLGAPPLTSSGDVTNSIFAPYVIDQMTFSPKFEVTAGVRYDHIDQDGVIMPLGFPAPIAYSRDDSEVSPLGGIVYAPGVDTSIYAHAAQSHAPPSTRLVDELDPAGREPEQGTQVEVGWKQRFLGGRLRTILAAYELERDRIAIADGTGFAQQSGDQRSRGLEIELAAEPRPRLHALFAYAYTDAELTDYQPCLLPDGMGGCAVQANYSGNTPIMAPEHIANLWVSQSFENGLGVSGGVRWVDEQFVSEDNLAVIDSSLVFNGALFYDARSWRAKLNLKNLTDEEYERRGIAGGAAVIPADPFAVYASIEFRLQ
jgi:TonB-dependent siderophore receptor